jgi:hypothetical protein
VKPVRLHHAALLLALPCLFITPASAATLNFSVTASEPVVVTGTPRIAIDVGGVTRYATYAAGSGTTALTFGYQVQPGDFDANGIAITSPLDLNGGSITDTWGNPANPLTFTLPDTSALKVQTYTAAFTTSPITETNANAVSFAIAKAPTGADFTYTITSSGGSGSVTGSGTIGAASHTVSGVDVSALPTGTLTLSVTLSSAAGSTGTARTASGTPTFSGVLDSLPAPAAAFSVRRLRDAYMGPLIRVRRSTDNATQDIGANVGGRLDVAALESFCGSSSCYVSAWYDQSGSGMNALQATVDRQPRIMNTGVLDKVNGAPAIKGDGVDDQMIFPLGSLTAFPVSINLVLAKTSTSEQGAWVKLGLSGGISIGVGGTPTYLTPGENIVALKEFASWVPTFGVLASAATITYTQDATTSSTAIYQNGTAVSVPNTFSAPLALDGGDGYLFGLYYSGRQRWSVNPIAEVILFPSLLSSANRLNLERNQGNYYGISVP